MIKIVRRIRKISRILRTFYWVMFGTPRRAGKAVPPLRAFLRAPGVVSHRQELAEADQIKDIYGSVPVQIGEEQGAFRGEAHQSIAQLQQIQSADGAVPVQVAQHRSLNIQLQDATQGEEIEFSGNELNATILRDDTAEGNWLKLGYFTTEANAETWVKNQLSIVAST